MDKTYKYLDMCSTDGKKWSQWELRNYAYKLRINTEKQTIDIFKVASVNPTYCSEKQLTEFEQIILGIEIPKHIKKLIGK